MSDYFLGDAANCTNHECIGSVKTDVTCHLVLLRNVLTLCSLYLRYTSIIVWLSDYYTISAGYDPPARTSSRHGYRPSAFKYVETSGIAAATAADIFSRPNRHFSEFWPRRTCYTSTAIQGSESTRCGGNPSGEFHGQQQHSPSEPPQALTFQEPQVTPQKAYLRTEVTQLREHVEYSQIEARQWRTRL